MSEPTPSSDSTAHESGLVPTSESEHTRTRVQQYLDSLELPEESDDEVIKNFIKEHNLTPRRAPYVEFQPPEVRAAYVRRSNAQIKAKLPRMTSAIRAVIESGLDYNQEDRERSFYPEEYYDVRAHDLKRILELDFEPPADGSLGRFGEDLLLKFLVASFYEKRFSPFYSDVIGETLQDPVLMRESLGKIEDVEDVLVSAIQVKLPKAVTHFDMDVYLDQVEPDFYPDLRRAYYLAVEPKVSVNQRIDSIRASEAVSSLAFS